MSSRTPSILFLGIFYICVGEAFRKYRHGRGKDRTIWCSETCVFWGTSSMKVKGSIQIKDIEDIVDGAWDMVIFRRLTVSRLLLFDLVST